VQESQYLLITAYSLKHKKPRKPKTVLEWGGGGYCRTNQTKPTGCGSIIHLCVQCLQTKIKENEPENWKNERNGRRTAFFFSQISAPIKTSLKKLTKKKKKKEKTQLCNNALLPIFQPQSPEECNLEPRSKPDKENCFKRKGIAQS
jgi:NAD(P)H-nitrite reductase large subunit